MSIKLISFLGCFLNAVAIGILVHLDSYGEAAFLTVYNILMRLERIEDK